MDRKQHLNLDKIIIQYLKKKIDISMFCRNSLNVTTIFESNPIHSYN